MKSFKRIVLMIGGFAVITGIVLIVLAISTQNTYFDANTFNYDFNESYQEVKSIELDVTYGNVTIEEGDSFHIEAHNMVEKSFSSTLTDGIWKIADDSELSNTLTGEIGLFDINIPVNTWFLWDNDKLPNIVVTIPPGFNADHISIKLEAGSIEAESLLAQEAEVEVGAGVFRIDNLTVSGKSFFSVGAGELIIDNIDVRNTTMDNGVGIIQASGKITGNSRIESDLGGINLKLAGNKDDYKYDIDCNLGSVKIDGRIRNSVMNQDADNSFILKCNAGNITVDFTK